MNEAKSLQITFSDGSIWRIPALFIANHRADYYVKKDKDTTLEKEIEFVLTDEYELEDWAKNNMDFRDVKEVAVRVKCPKDCDYDKEWCNAEYVTIRED